MKSAFDHASNYVQGVLENSNTDSREIAYIVALGVAEARLGLILNTLRAHHPKAYEMLIEAYDWGEETVDTV